VLLVYKFPPASTPTAWSNNFILTAPVTGLALLLFMFSVRAGAYRQDETCQLDDPPFGKNPGIVQSIRRFVLFAIVNPTNGIPRNGNRRDMPIG
jgi:hypothetical protein